MEPEYDKLRMSFENIVKYLKGDGKVNRGNELYIKNHSSIC